MSNQKNSSVPNGSPAPSFTAALVQQGPVKEISNPPSNSPQEALARNPLKSPICPKLGGQ
jgi:hypothetical protein